MALDILDKEAGDYDAIRALLDLGAVGVSGEDPAQIVTDAVIEMIIYGGRAETYIKQRDPQWATRTDDELVYLRQAAIYLTAYYLSPAIPVLLKENFGDYSYTRSDKNMVGLRARFKSASEEALGWLLGPPDGFPNFITVPGRRGA